MPELNNKEPNGARIAVGKLKDGWSYEIKRMPVSGRFCATVLHPFGAEASGGVPWPIEDSKFESDPAHPTYSTADEAIAAAHEYLDRLSELHGYPDPDKMSARGFRPALW